MHFWKTNRLLFHVYFVALISEKVFCEFQFSGDKYHIIISELNQRLLQNCIFPHTLPLRFVSLLNKGYNVTLLLHKNNIFDTEAIVYSVKSSSWPVTLIPDNGGTDKNIAYYQDARHGAFISVQCSKKSQTVIYGGILHYNGNQLKVQYQTDTDKYNTQIGSLKYDKNHFSGAIKESFPEIHVQPTRIIRDVKGSVTSYTVEILVVVDYSVFQKWLFRQNDINEDTNVRNAKLEIQNYYTQVMNGVDLRYKNIKFTDFDIRIKPIGFIIADSPDIFSWTASRKTSSKLRNHLNADNALKDFRNWLNKTKGLPEHDHAVLFTSYDLYTVKKNQSSKMKFTSGLAYIGTLCQYGDSVSVVEEQGGFQSVGTTAHEIGHSLNARHDGEDNPCRSEDRYIMAASGIGPVPQDKRFNPWHFSSCSVEYFRNFIASLLANGSRCLLDSSVKNQEIPYKSIPGQVYNADEQCRLIWGPKSYLCRGAEFGNASSICTGMYCRDPSTANDCVLHTAARGSSCGNKQWCIDGKCTYSVHAPEFKDGCVLGDQPGAAFNGMSCDELVNQTPSYCYQSKVRARCCTSCRKHFTWRQGCEYGNRVQGCQSWHCSRIFRTRDIFSDCCSTCNVGAIILPTKQPVWDTGIQTTTVAAHVCRDSDEVNNMDCASFIKYNGQYVCYSPSVSNICCKTCLDVADVSNEGCEFGDRSPVLCAKINNVTSLHCSKYGIQCCGTCIKETNTAHKVSSVIVLYFIVLYNLSFEYVVK